MITFGFSFDARSLSEIELGDQHGWMGALFSGFLGSFSIASGDLKYRIDHVPLLWIAAAIHRMLTVPALYGREVVEPIPDLVVNIRARMSNEGVVLEVIEDLSSRSLSFFAPLVETMQSFGGSYRRLIEELSIARRDIAANDLFMSLLPDGSLLSREVLYGEPSAGGIEAVRE